MGFSSAREYVTAGGRCPGRALMAAPTALVWRPALTPSAVCFQAVLFYFTYFLTKLARGFLRKNPSDQLPATQKSIRVSSFYFFLLLYELILDPLKNPSAHSKVQQLYKRPFPAALGSALSSLGAGSCYLGLPRLRAGPNSGVGAQCDELSLVKKHMCGRPGNTTY